MKWHVSQHWGTTPTQDMYTVYKRLNTHTHTHTSAYIHYTTCTWCIIMHIHVYVLYVQADPVSLMYSDALWWSHVLLLRERNCVQVQCIVTPSLLNEYTCTCSTYYIVCLSPWWHCTCDCEMLYLGLESYSNWISFFSLTRPNTFSTYCILVVMQ